MKAGRWAAALLLISAGLLGYELLLMRLLALAYWGHFAGFVISVAMLGIAAAGMFLHFVRSQVVAQPGRSFARSAAAFALLAPVAFLVSQLLPFTPFLLTWSPREYMFLGGRALLFFGAFFAAGVAIGVPFVAKVLPMGRLYFWNMLGSGLPAVPLLVGMNWMHPMRLLIPVSLCAIASAVIMLRRRGERFLWLAAMAAAMVFVAVTPFRYSEYKDLSRTLLLPDAKILEERYGWDAVVHVVDSPHTRHLPGLSLNFAAELPPARLLFTDASAMTLLVQPDDARAHPEFLAMTPEAFSYEISEPQRALHLYGATTDLMRSKLAGVPDVRLIDDSATRAEVTREFLPVEGGFREAIVHADPREALSGSEKWELISLALVGSHGTSAAGAASLEPMFLLTTEGFGRIFDHLAADGHAVTSTWVEHPARSGVRLIGLWVEALRRQGIADPGRHLLALRSWSTVTIFTGRQPFGPQQVAKLKAFADEQSYDLVWYPGIEPAETNRINVIPDDPYFAAFKAMLGTGASEFIKRSPFAIAAPALDRPFFNQQFRWKAVPQWLSTLGMDWLPFIEWGYILHVATIGVVTILGLLLLIGPAMATGASPAFRTASLFLALGVAYMFVQLWAIYRLSELLAHPLLAAALVLTVMLIASGTGAAILTGRQNSPANRNLLVLCGSLGAAIMLFPLLMELFFAHSVAARIAAAVLWLALPAFFMGFPFPHALAELVDPPEIPWALALNGFGSVLGALLATLVAVHAGFLALGVAGVLLYVAAALLVSGLSSKGHGLTSGATR